MPVLSSPFPITISGQLLLSQCSCTEYIWNQLLLFPLMLPAICSSKSFFASFPSISSNSLLINLTDAKCVFLSFWGAEFQRAAQELCMKSRMQTALKTFSFACLSGWVSSLSKLQMVPLDLLAASGVVMISAGQRKVLICFWFSIQIRPLLSPPFNRNGTIYVLLAFHLSDTDLNTTVYCRWISTIDQFLTFGLSKRFSLFCSLAIHWTFNSLNRPTHCLNFVSASLKSPFLICSWLSFSDLYQDGVVPWIPEQDQGVYEREESKLPLKCGLPPTLSWLLVPNSSWRGQAP